MKNKPLHLWTTLYEKERNYHLLKLRLFQGYKHDFHRFPVPAYDRSYDSDCIELSFQATVGETRPGTLDGPRWYGGRYSLERQRIGGKSELHSWFSRIVPESMGFADLGVPGLLTALQSKAQRVAHSSELASYVPLEHYDRAQTFRCYIDKGITTSGCIINAYVRAGATDEEITAAVSRALRDSQCASTEELAAWVNAGRKFELAYRSPAPPRSPPRSPPSSARRSPRNSTSPSPPERSHTSPS